MMISIQIRAIILAAVSTQQSSRPLRASLAGRFEGAAGKRLLWVCAIVMLVFGAAELPALGKMSELGTGVLGFEFATTTDRLREILTRWGSAGRTAAQQHVFIDLGFILGYGLLLIGLCGRLSERLRHQGHPRAATLAALLAWGALVAAVANALQKVVLWLELHGNVTQPLPALAAVCGALTFILGISAAVFAVAGGIAVQRMPCEAAPEGLTK